MNFKHILFPVDYSEQSTAAAPRVNAVAKKYGAKITLLHVETTPGVIYGALHPRAASQNAPAQAAEQAQRQLDAFLPDGFEGVAVERVVKQGDPAGCIADYVKTEGIDLVMMPTHGLGVFRGVLLGSVAAKVLHDVNCPVWTGVHLEQPFTENRVDCLRVLCAVDLAPETVPILKYADRVASDYGAALRIVHAVTAIKARPEKHHEIELQTYLIDFARQEIAKFQAEAGTKFEVHLEAGPVAQVVRAAAMQHSADVVIIGRGAVGHLLGRLRTHSYAIIRESPCPVLSI